MTSRNNSSASNFIADRINSSLITIPRATLTGRTSRLVQSQYSETDGGQRNLQTSSDSDEKTKEMLSISRTVYTQPDFDAEFRRTSKLADGGHKKSKVSGCLQLASCRSFLAFFKSLFPILTWLPKYKTSFLVPDIVAGITVAIFQVPESMGYAFIAQVAPVYALYSAFFPSLMYAIFGTAKHSNIGAVAAVAIMTGGIIKQVQEENGWPPNPNSLADGDSEPHSSVEIATTVALIIGLYQLILGLLRFGFVSCYMPEHLITGFTGGVAYHVLTSQFKHMFGVAVNTRTGPLALFYTYQDMIPKIIKYTNFVELTVSLVCLVALLIFKFYLNDKIKSMLKTQVPFPAEILVVAGATIVSGVFDLNKKYDVKIIGSIPTGLPEPILPNLDIVPLVWTKCIPLAVVCFTLCYSIGKTFGTKHGYPIDASQEMVAMGAVNIFASVWSCIPCSTSLARSAICEGTGGKSQIHTFFNGGVILAVLFLLGPYLQVLPRAVLAAIIAVALRNLLLSVTNFKQYWNTNKIDASIWLVTFSSVIIVDMDLGLYIGVAYSLVTLVYKSQRPKMYLLGRVGADVWVPMDRYSKAEEIPGVKIYQFCGPLHFANTEYFRNGLTLTMGFSVKMLKKSMKKLEKSNSITLKTINVQMDVNGNVSQFNEPDHPTHVILDCSMLSYIDTAGIKALREAIEEYKSVEMETLLAGCPTHVTKLLERSDGFYAAVSPDHVFISIQDAVEYANKQRKKDLGKVIARDSETGASLVRRM